jgi:hypothetical protein
MVSVHSLTSAVNPCTGKRCTWPYHAENPRTPLKGLELMPLNTERLWILRYANRVGQIDRCIESAQCGRVKKGSLSATVFHHLEVRANPQRGNPVLPSRKPTSRKVVTRPRLWDRADRIASRTAESAPGGLSWRRFADNGCPQPAMPHPRSPSRHTMSCTSVVSHPIGDLWVACHPNREVTLRPELRNDLSSDRSRPG